MARTERLHVRISPAEQADLEAEAERLGVTVAELVRARLARSGGDIERGEGGDDIGGGNTLNGGTRA
jgi:hypothetical protein